MGNNNGVIAFLADSVDDCIAIPIKAQGFAVGRFTDMALDKDKASLWGRADASNVASDRLVVQDVLHQVTTHAFLNRL